MRTQRIRNKYRYNQKGFTLVELIVVLAILSILASAAVFSVIGYIDQSRFDKNEQNAQSLYQAVQTALGRKKNSGEIEDWVKNVLMVKGEQDPYLEANHDRDAEGKALDDCYDSSVFNGFPRQQKSVGDSVHMRYILTYMKDGNGGQNEVILNLVGGYFYDTTILDATFTIEFDVEKKIGGDEEVHYNANAYAVFYDERRTGWDEKAMRNLSCVVPYRDSSYRSDTSLVGYYNGGNPAAVDSVYTPMINNKMEFAELALRNGEKLELSFSVVYGNQNITGMKDENGKPYHIHYTASVYDQLADEKLADLVISEAYLTKAVSGPDISAADYGTILNAAIGDKRPTVTIDGKSYPVTYATETLQDDTKTTFTRTKATVESTAYVYVHRGKDAFEYNNLKATELGTEARFYTFPLTVSYVVKEYSPTVRKEYVSYSIALDAMMTRQTIAQNESEAAKSSYETFAKKSSSSITRLLKDDTVLAVKNHGAAPRNIYVTMTASADAFAADTELTDYNVTKDLPSSESTKAKRAYDDPVYLLENGSYAYSEGKAIRDDDAGYAVCNTYFGDLGNGSFGNRHETPTAVITSFRHLYNMRFTTQVVPEVSEGTKEVCYEIRRDLNWYQKTQSGYTSDVEIFGFVNSAVLTGYSPAGISGGTTNDLKLVAWPALPEVSKNQILVAKENSISANTDDCTAVIRNIQMRRQSFLTHDSAYGMICTNNGTLCNIRCENLCLTLDTTEDGVASDVAEICSAIKLMAENGYNNYDSNRPKDKSGVFLDDVPVGGLLGQNKGTLGDASVTDMTQNTICMTNPIVITGAMGKGSLNMYKFMKGTGAVAGVYVSTGETASYGQIRTCGRFALIGFKLTGGVFGAVYKNVDAQLYVDSTNDRDKEKMLFYPEGFDGVVMSRVVAGGAVGLIDGGCFAQKEPAFDPEDTDEGVVNVSSPEKAEEYAVSVHLSGDSQVWHFGEDSDTTWMGVGGAVGEIKNYPAGKILSIQSINEGKIMVGEKATGRYLGGAVGYMLNGSASRMYIQAQNNGLIGTKDGTAAMGKSYAVAAGIGYMNNFGAANDVYVIDTQNSGKLYCNLNNSDYTGAGLAIGAAQLKSSPTLYVKAVNSGVVNGTNVSKDQTSGVGGAIGFVNNLQHSHIYAEMQSQSQIHSTGFNTGGAVGAIREKSSGNSAADLLTITAFLQPGAEITSDGTNAGGCVGTMLRQGNYSSLRTKVLGNCTISGKENVGGVAGRAQQNGGGDGASVYLTGAAEAPVLTVRAASDKKNVGGAIGQVGVSEGTYKTEIHMPKQDGTDDLVLALEGYENVGGMIGRMTLTDFTNSASHFNCETPKFSVILHPASVITATNQYAGGAIGLFEDKTEDLYFKSDVEVTIREGATAPVISGPQNIGGVFGSIKACHFDGNLSSYIYSSNAVKGNKSVGGVVGYTEITRSAGGFRTQINASDAIVAQEGAAGGCIGVLGEKAEYEYVEAQFGPTDGTIAAITPINANGGDLGGCIGRMNTTATVKQATTVVNTSAPLISQVPSDKNSIGGVIGYVKDAGNVSSLRLTGNSGAELILIEPGSSFVGGLVGVAEVQNGNKTAGIRAHLGEVSVEVPVNISGNKCVGGCYGVVKYTVLGKEENAATVTIDNVGTITAAYSGSNHTDGGTGAFAGVITADSVVNCPVTVKLTAGNSVSGGFNTGGVIGLVAESVLKGDMTTHFAGGCIRSDKGGLGGVIGSLQGYDKPAVVKNLSAYIDEQYGSGNAAATPLCAITDNAGTGIGAVVGQIGGWTRSNEANRTYPIDIETISLHLAHNLVIAIGNTSVGGVIGQCESSNATIKNIKVQSDGAEIHIQPPMSHKDVMDIGGIIGNMLGYLEETITVNNVDFYVSGKRYVGGWIGAMDGRFGTDSTSRTLYVTGIKKVEGSLYGIGGVIGATGCWRSIAKVYYNFDVDLKDAEIRCTSRDYGNTHGTGGVIGLVGDPKGDANKTSSLSSVLYGNVNLKLNNTKITGYGNVGAIYGFLQSGSNIASSTNLTLVIEGDSWVTSESAKNGDKHAGGMIGNNEAAFRARTFIEMSSGAVFRVSAPGGYAGGLIGKNANAFGRSGSDEFTIPKDNIGTIIVDGNYTGAILGWNSSANGIAGQCGTVKLSGDDVDEGSGTLTYHVMNVELKGTYDKRYPRAGYVGKNNYDKDANRENSYNIYNVVIDGDYETDPSTIPEDTQTDTEEEEWDDPDTYEWEDPDIHNWDEWDEPDIHDLDEFGNPEEPFGHEESDGVKETREETDIPEKEDSEEEDADIVHDRDHDAFDEGDPEENFETEGDSGDDEDSEA